MTAPDRSAITEWPAVSVVGADSPAARMARPSRVRGQHKPRHQPEQHREIHHRRLVEEDLADPRDVAQPGDSHISEQRLGTLPHHVAAHIGGQAQSADGEGQARHHLISAQHHTHQGVESAHQMRQPPRRQRTPPTDSRFPIRP